jgi:hypothetical protein
VSQFPLLELALTEFPLFGRSHDEAVQDVFDVLQDVLDDLIEQGEGGWRDVDPHVVAGYLDWMVSIGGAPHVAEAIWRHVELINDEDGAA